MFYCSKDDIIQIPGGDNLPVVVSAGSVRGMYNQIKDKAIVAACIDLFGAYHIALGETESPNELLFVDGNWTDQQRDHYPKVMRNGYLGLVWFMDPLGNIYSNPDSLVNLIGYGTSYGAANEEA